MANQVTDTGGVYFVPAFSGLGTPHWDMSARGAFMGITGGTKPEHMVRAVLEAIPQSGCLRHRIPSKRSSRCNQCILHYIGTEISRRWGSVRK